MPISHRPILELTEIGSETNSLYLRLRKVCHPENACGYSIFLTLYDADLDLELTATAEPGHFSHLLPYIDLLEQSRCDLSFEPPVIPVTQGSDGRWRFSHLMAEIDYPELSGSLTPPLIRDSCPPNLKRLTLSPFPSTVEQLTTTPRNRTRYGSLKRKRHLHLSDEAHGHLVTLAQQSGLYPSEICEQIIRNHIAALAIPSPRSTTSPATPTTLSLSSTHGIPLPGPS